MDQDDALGWIWVFGVLCQRGAVVEYDRDFIFVAGCDPVRNNGECMSLCSEGLCDYCFVIQEHTVVDAALFRSALGCHASM